MLNYFEKWKNGKMEKEYLIIVEEDFDYYKIIGVIEPKNLENFIEQSKDMMMKSVLGLNITKVDYYPQTEDLYYEGTLLFNKWSYVLKVYVRTLNKIYK